MRYGRDTVGGVIVRLRKMLGHVGKKDRATVTEAIGAIEELATRLYEATQPQDDQEPPRGSLTITRAAEDTDGEEETSPAETRA